MPKIPKNRPSIIQRFYSLPQGAGRIAWSGLKGVSKLLWYTVLADKPKPPVELAFEAARKSAGELSRRTNQGLERFFRGQEQGSSRIRVPNNSISNISEFKGIIDKELERFKTLQQQHPLVVHRVNEANATLSRVSSQVQAAKEEAQNSYSSALAICQADLASSFAAVDAELTQAIADINASSPENVQYLTRQAQSNASTRKAAIQGQHADRVRKIQLERDRKTLQANGELQQAQNKENKATLRSRNFHTELETFRRDLANLPYKLALDLIDSVDNRIGEIINLVEHTLSQPKEFLTLNVHENAISQSELESVLTSGDLEKILDLDFGRLSTHQQVLALLALFVEKTSKQSPDKPPPIRQYLLEIDEAFKNAIGEINVAFYSDSQIPSASPSLNREKGFKKIIEGFISKNPFVKQSAYKLLELLNKLSEGGSVLTGNETNSQRPKSTWIHSLPGVGDNEGTIQSNPESPPVHTDRLDKLNAFETGLLLNLRGLPEVSQLTQEDLFTLAQKNIILPGVVLKTGPVSPNSCERAWQRAIYPGGHQHQLTFDVVNQHNQASELNELLLYVRNLKDLHQIIDQTNETALRGTPDLVTLKTLLLSHHSSLCVLEKEIKNLIEGSKDLDKFTPPEDIPIPFNSFYELIHSLLSQNHQIVSKNKTLRQYLEYIEYFKGEDASSLVRSVHEFYRKPLHQRMSELRIFQAVNFDREKGLPQDLLKEVADKLPSPANLEVLSRKCLELSSPERFADRLLTPPPGLGNSPGAPIEDTNTRTFLANYAIGILKGLVPILQSLHRENPEGINDWFTPQRTIVHSLTPYGLTRDQLTSAQNLSHLQAWGWVFTPYNRTTGVEPQITLISQVKLPEDLPELMRLYQTLQEVRSKTPFYSLPLFPSESNLNEALTQTILTQFPETISLLNEIHLRLCCFNIAWRDPKEYPSRQSIEEALKGREGTGEQYSTGKPDLASAMKQMLRPANLQSLLEHYPKIKQLITAPTEADHGIIQSLQKAGGLNFKLNKLLKDSLKNLRDPDITPVTRQKILDKIWKKIGAFLGSVEEELMVTKTALEDGNSSKLSSTQHIVDDLRKQMQEVKSFIGVIRRLQNIEMQLELQADSVIWRNKVGQLLGIQMEMYFQEAFSILCKEVESRIAELMAPKLEEIKEQLTLPVEDYRYTPQNQESLNQTLNKRMEQLQTVLTILSNDYLKPPISPLLKASPPVCQKLISDLHDLSKQSDGFPTMKYSEQVGWLVRAEHCISTALDVYPNYGVGTSDNLDLFQPYKSVRMLVQCLQDFHELPLAAKDHVEMLPFFRDPRENKLFPASVIQIPLHGTQDKAFYTRIVEGVLKAYGKPTRKTDFPGLSLEILQTLNSVIGTLPYLKLRTSDTTIEPITLLTLVGKNLFDLEVPFTFKEIDSFYDGFSEAVNKLSSQNIPPTERIDRLFQLCLELLEKQREHDKESNGAPHQVAERIKPLIGMWRQTADDFFDSNFNLHKTVLLKAAELIEISQLKYICPELYFAVFDYQRLCKIVQTLKSSLAKSPEQLTGSELRVIVPFFTHMMNTRILEITGTLNKLADSINSDPQHPLLRVFGIMVSKDTPHMDSLTETLSGYHTRINLALQRVATELGSISSGQQVQLPKDPVRTFGAISNFLEEQIPPYLNGNTDWNNIMTLGDMKPPPIREYKVRDGQLFPLAPLFPQHHLSSGKYFVREVLPNGNILVYGPEGKCVPLVSTSPGVFTPYHEGGGLDPSMHLILQMVNGLKDWWLDNKNLLQKIQLSSKKLAPKVQTIQNLLAPIIPRDPSQSKPLTVQSIHDGLLPEILCDLIMKMKDQEGLSDEVHTLVNQLTLPTTPSKIELLDRWRETNGQLWNLGELSEELKDLSSKVFNQKVCKDVQDFVETLQNTSNGLSFIPQEFMDFASKLVQVATFADWLKQNTPQFQSFNANPELRHKPVQNFGIFLKNVRKDLWPSTPDEFSRLMNTTPDELKSKLTQLADEITKFNSDFGSNHNCVLTPVEASKSEESFSSQVQTLIQKISQLVQQRREFYISKATILKTTNRSNFPNSLQQILKDLEKVDRTNLGDEGRKVLETILDPHISSVGQLIYVFNSLNLSTTLTGDTNSTLLRKLDTFLNQLAQSNPAETYTKPQNVPDSFYLSPAEQMMNAIRNTLPPEIMKILDSLNLTQSSSEERELINSILNPWTLLLWEENLPEIVENIDVTTCKPSVQISLERLRTLLLLHFKQQSQYISLGTIQSIQSWSIQSAALSFLPEDLQLKPKAYSLDNDRLSLLLETPNGYYLKTKNANGYQLYPLTDKQVLDQWLNLPTLVIPSFLEMVEDQSNDRLIGKYYPTDSDEPVTFVLDSESNKWYQPEINGGRKYPTGKGYVTEIQRQDDTLLFLNLPNGQQVPILSASDFSDKLPAGTVSVLYPTSFPNQQDSHFGSQIFQRGPYHDLYRDQIAELRGITYGGNLHAGNVVAFNAVMDLLNKTLKNLTIQFSLSSTIPNDLLQDGKRGRGTKKPISSTAKSSIPEGFPAALNHIADLIQIARTTLTVNPHEAKRMNLSEQIPMILTNLQRIHKIVMSDIMQIQSMIEDKQTQYKTFAKLMRNLAKTFSQTPDEVFQMLLAQVESTEISYAQIIRVAQMVELFTGFLESPPGKQASFSEYFKKSVPSELMYAMSAVFSPREITRIFNDTLSIHGLEINPGNLVSSSTQPPSTQEPYTTYTPMDSDQRHQFETMYFNPSQGLSQISQWPATETSDPVFQNFLMNTYLGNNPHIADQWKPIVRPNNVPIPMDNMQTLVWLTMLNVPEDLEILREARVRTTEVLKIIKDKNMPINLVPEGNQLLSPELEAFPKKASKILKEVNRLLYLELPLTLQASATELFGPQAPKDGINSTEMYKGLADSKKLTQLYTNADLPTDYLLEAFKTAMEEQALEWLKSSQRGLPQSTNLGAQRIEGLTEGTRPSILSEAKMMTTLGIYSDIPQTTNQKPPNDGDGKLSSGKRPDPNAPASSSE